MKDLIWAAFYTLGALISVLIVHDYFGTVLGSRKISKKNLLVIYALFLIALSIFMFGNKIYIMIIYFSGMLGISFLYKSDIKIRILSCVILLTLQLLSETLTAVLTSLFTHQTVAYLTNTLLFYIQGELMSKLFVFTIVKTFSYYKCTTYSKISRYFFIPLLLFPVSTTFIIYSITSYVNVLKNTGPSILIVCSSILLIISNILLFYLFEKQLEQEEEKHHSQLIQQQLQYQAEYFHELADKQKLSNRTVHDLKNQLFAISILLSDTTNERIEKAKNKVDELCNNIYNGQTISQTGNDALDALINSKYQRMPENNIEFKKKILIHAVNQIDDIDLCIVIGNALDNAIEACLKAPVDVHREISLKIVQIGDYLSIEIKNTMADAVPTGNGQLLPMEIGKIVTSKSEKALHGFGLKSIEEISNKYGGCTNIDINNGFFSLKIYMMNKMLDPILQN